MQMVVSLLLLCCSCSGGGRTHDRTVPVHKKITRNKFFSSHILPAAAKRALPSARAHTYIHPTPTHTHTPIYKHAHATHSQPSVVCLASPFFGTHLTHTHTHTHTHTSPPPPPQLQKTQQRPLLPFGGEMCRAARRCVVVGVCACARTAHHERPSLDRSRFPFHVASRPHTHTQHFAAATASHF